MRDRPPQAPIKPEQTFRFEIVTWVLDMRNKTDLLGKDLSDLIHRSVYKTQHPIMQQLPDWLILSHKQFDSLLDYTEPMEFGNADGRIFITPYNVMEVDVDLELDPVDQPEILDFDDDTSFEVTIPQGGRFSRS